jgi:hypothetical protein
MITIAITTGASTLLLPAISGGNQTPLRVQHLETCPVGPIYHPQNMRHSTGETKIL